ncbi:hypothetical protein [Treponema sp. UBA753]|uniref:hypothetical protein n=1 Tax=Treponema sp. UBA753 TaxID=1947747 RepID=UPI0025D9F48B|nr:hypothetical protein [Treponema sp. UBA753]
MQNIAALTKMITALDEDSLNSVANYVIYLTSVKEKSSDCKTKQVAFDSLMKLKGKIAREIDPKKELLEALDEKYSRAY